MAKINIEDIVNEFRNVKEISIMGIDFKIAKVPFGAVTRNSDIIKETQKATKLIIKLQDLQRQAESLKEGDDKELDRIEKETKALTEKIGDLSDIAFIEKFLVIIKMILVANKYEYDAEFWELADGAEIRMFINQCLNKESNLKKKG